MIRALIHIRGIVQGVGFRPFIHKLVTSYRLKGFIKNTSSGVELELEGEKRELERFVLAIEKNAPPLALIEEIDVSYTRELKHFSSFDILSSKIEALRNTLISPDIALCDDCKRELLDPADRRFRYPFINCTNCGPRFTIIRDLPYDRSLTSMGRFPMCLDCDREYHDILDRRYHAQPDCCPVCGPQVFYLEGEKRFEREEAIQAALKALEEGKILAVKGLGGIHLACRADDPVLIERLRRRKQRDEKPFAIMCRDMAAVRRLCLVDEEEEKLLSGQQKPIVLLQKRDGAPDALSENRTLGVMLPYTPLHLLLLSGSLDTLVMTSANLSDTPILTENAEALEKLSGIADAFLLHNRDIQTRCDDSLCAVIGGEPLFLRRSRGYVPYPVHVPGVKDAILACGAEQKASFAMSRGEHVFLSQHIGDLKNAETYAHYSDQISHFEHLFDIRPRLLVCDLHPDYLSTIYAHDRTKREELQLLRVQHHHAHMASCMADNGLTDPVIGLCWDGTGYGDDGEIWGGECLIGDFHSFERFGSLRPIPLVGGDLAVKELDRVAFALLYESGYDASCIEKAAFYEKQLLSGFNCPRSSGMGRLFDGVAALLGLKRFASYEGQGAVLLEAAAAQTEEHYEVCFEGAPLRFDWRELVRAVWNEKHRGVDVRLIAGRFHRTLIEMARRLCLKAREERCINTVCLTGGSFQNRILLEGVSRALQNEGFETCRQRRVAPNDEGLCLGQLCIGQAWLNHLKTGDQCDVPGGTPKADRDPRR